MNREYEIIKQEIESIAVDLDIISEENFDKINNKIFKSVEKIKKMHTELEGKISPGELKSYDNEVMESVKLILKRFDSIIKEKKIEQQKIAEELKSFENKKKLNKYIR